MQERGLRLIYGDHSSPYKDLLNKSRRDLLFVSRIKRLAMLVFKSVYSIGPPFLHDLFSIKNSKYDLRNENKNVIQPRVNSSKYGLSSLRYSGSVIWNNLPHEFKTCISEDLFKKF